jgi:hypothetical protein
VKKKPPSRPRFFDLLKITGIGGYEQNKIPAQTVENHQTTLQKIGWVGIRFGAFLDHRDTLYL